MNYNINIILPVIQVVSSLLEPIILLAVTLNVYCVPELSILMFKKSLSMNMLKIGSKSVS